MLSSIPAYSYQDLAQLVPTQRALNPSIPAPQELGSVGDNATTSSSQSVQKQSSDIEQVSSQYLYQPERPIQDLVNFVDTTGATQEQVVGAAELKHQAEYAEFALEQFEEAMLDEEAEQQDSNVTTFNDQILQLSKEAAASRQRYEFLTSERLAAYDPVQIQPIISFKV